MSLPPPVVVYPNTVTSQPTSHSKGSFGPVFIVLAVIIVLSAFACCLGQICARRFSNSKAKRKNHKDVHPKDGDNDIEFGFKKKIPTGKPVSHGEIRELRPYHDGEMREPRAFHGGDMKEPKPFHNGEMKGSRTFHSGEMRETRSFHKGDMRESRPFHNGEMRETRPFHNGEMREPRPFHNGEMREPRSFHNGEAKFADHGEAKATG